MESHANTWVNLGLKQFHRGYWAFFSSGLAHVFSLRPLTQGTLHEHFYFQFLCIVSSGTIRPSEKTQIILYQQMPALLSCHGKKFILFTGKIAFIHWDLIEHKHCSRYQQHVEVYHGFHFQYKLDFRQIFISLFEIRLYLRKVSVICIYLTCWQQILRHLSSLELRQLFPLSCFYEQSSGNFSSAGRQCSVGKSSLLRGSAFVKDDQEGPL